MERFTQSSVVELLDVIKEKGISGNQRLTDIHDEMVMFSEAKSISPIPFRSFTKILRDYGLIVTKQKGMSFVNIPL